MVKINEGFPERLSSMRKTHTMTQTELALKVGISQRQIAAYEAGKAKPRPNTLLDLAFYLGVPSTWLATGINSNINESKNYTPAIYQEQIAVFNLNDFDLSLFAKKGFDTKGIELYPLPDNLKNIHGSAFAIRMFGDSMEISKKLGIPDGSIVTFNMNAEIKSGDICLIEIDNIYSIKQLFIDANQTTAHPLNANYSDIILKKGEYKIIAKAVRIDITL
jgi:SOS-response transcriptional repressor LexA